MSADATQGTKTATLAVTIGEGDVSYSCKYQANDGFSVEDYIEHQACNKAISNIPN